MRESVKLPVGIVLSGGGMYCAYGVGALRALIEVHGIDRPQVVVAQSGGAATAAFGLVHRFSEMYQWSELYDDPRFISWRRFGYRPVMDIDFLVDSILRRQAPQLDRELSEQPTKVFIGATKFPEGSTHWFTNEPLFEQFRAAKMLPGIGGEGVMLDGQHFADGCLSTSLQACVDKAMAEGAEHVIVIDNSTPGAVSTLTKLVLQVGSQNFAPYVRAAVARFSERVNEPLEQTKRIVVCRPSRVLARHPLVRRAHISRRSIKTGYADASRLQLE